VAALSFHPGLIDIGLTKKGTSAESADNQWVRVIAEWTEREKAAGKFTPVEYATAALLRLAAGAGDHLSGRYLTTEDDCLSFPATDHSGERERTS
jgi:hypothetical protein